MKRREGQRSRQMRERGRRWRIKREFARRLNAKHLKQLSWCTGVWWWQIMLVIILSYVWERRRREAYHRNFNNSFGINKTWAADFCLPEWKALRKVNVSAESPVLTLLNLTGPLRFSPRQSFPSSFHGVKPQRKTLWIHIHPNFSIPQSAQTQPPCNPACGQSRFNDCAWKMSISVCQRNGVKMREGTEQSIRSIHLDRTQKNGF